MLYRLLISSIAIVSLAGCGVTVNMMTPEHIFRITQGSIVSDPNGGAMSAKHNGWYVSDRTMSEVVQAKIK